MPFLEGREPQGIARLDCLKTPAPGSFQAQSGLFGAGQRAEELRGAGLQIDDLDAVALGHIEKVSVCTERRRHDGFQGESSARKTGTNYPLQRADTIQER